jgi:DNA processing protein
MAQTLHGGFRVERRGKAVEKGMKDRPPGDAGELAARVALSHVGQIGPARFETLLARFGAALAAWTAPHAELAEAIGPVPAEALVTVRRRLDPSRALAAVEGLGLAAVAPGDPGYPDLLRQTPAPPFVLFVNGSLNALQAPCLAVIGARRASTYGQMMAGRLARGLARRGVTIVSGLAAGVDSEAHRAALEVGGCTVAVLPGGADRAYPACNRRLLASIVAAGGAAVSEKPPGTPAMKHLFPLRNRIIAGLCTATVVVEAGRRSGALITAAAALDAGRLVMAVPHAAVGPAWEGTYHLLRNGAAPVADATDVLDDAGLAHLLAPDAPGTNLPPELRPLFETLARAPATMDDLAAATGWPVGEVAQALTRLELAGLARPFSGPEWEAIV